MSVVFPTISVPYWLDLNKILATRRTGCRAVIHSAIDVHRRHLCLLGLRKTVKAMAALADLVGNKPQPSLCAAFAARLCQVPRRGTRQGERLELVVIGLIKRGLPMGLSYAASGLSLLLSAAAQLIPFAVLART